MRKYYVHYEINLLRQHMRMIMPVDAESEAEAIEICKADRVGSFDHWVKQSSAGKEHLQHLLDLAQCSEV
tara:strand:+ start:137 stop:346 length:210 start_codon:yes stop_codon:yes gene_type:complete